MGGSPYPRGNAIKATLKWAGIKYVSVISVPYISLLFSQNLFQKHLLPYGETGASCHTSIPVNISSCGFIFESQF